MWLLLLIIFGIYAPYYLVINGIRRLWFNLDVPDPDIFSDRIPSVSIIIPFRNEMENLPSLVDSLMEQVDVLSEVILVNDHSTDASQDDLHALISGFSNFSILENDSEGKKAALTKGIYHASNEWIIALDADVRLSLGWFNELVERIDETDDMVILPVALRDDKTLFQKFEAFDFLALQGFTFCYARDRKPFLANGAHLAFKKSVWRDVNGYESHDSLASGDDVFLLQAFRKQGKVIGWEWSEELIVHTDCNQSLTDFFHQKIRWGSKTSKIDLKESKLLSILIVLANLGLLLLCLIGAWKFLLLALIIKSITDLNFVLPVLLSYQRKDLIKFVPVFILLYPFYITFVGIATLIIKPKWKGRKV